LYLEQGQLTQSVSMNDNLQNQYITLTMQQCDADKVVDAVMALPDINSIEKKQHNEFLIKHNSEEDYAIERAHV